MATYSTAIIHLGTEGLEEVEVLIECYMDGRFRTDVQGMNPSFDKFAGWKCEPFITRDVQETFQKLVNGNQKIQDDCIVAFNESERMSA